MIRLGFSTLAVAIGLAAAPQLQAQTTSQLLVCRDGQVMSSRAGVRACDNHGGIDQQATLRARNGNRGVYNGTANGSVNGQRGVYSGGAANGSNRQIYGGINDGRGVLDRNTRRDRDIRMHRQEHHDNGKHKGWYKHHHKDHGRGEHGR